jgi:guanylate kinase
MEDTLAQKLQGYTTSPEAIELIKATKILLLVGPTGAGKDALKIELLKTNSFHHIVSHTTRPIRINHGIPEEDGLDYHFIDKKKAEDMLDNHEFIEAKLYSGNLYGTSVSEIRAAHDDNKIAMTDVEIQGVKEYKQLDPNVTAIFLLPPSFVVWQDRLTKRYGDVVDLDDYKLRLQTALDELDELMNTDYYEAVVNDYMPSTYKQVSDIIVDGVKPDQTKAHETAAELIREIKDYLSKA